MTHSEKEKLKRPKKRIVGGVCEALGKKYKFDPIWLRIILVFTTIFIHFTLIVYLIFWLFIPNHRKIEDKNKRNLYQALGIILGGVSGAVIGFFAPYIIFGAISGLVLLYFGIVGFPIGVLLGFLIGREILER